MRYKTRLKEVDAVCYSKDNVQQIVARGGGLIEDGKDCLIITTPEFHVIAEPGDYVLRDGDGQFRTMSASLFASRYEAT